MRVTLRGGLGNQLFQWATGYSLAKRLGTKLFLHANRIEKIANREIDDRVYELGYFGLEVSHLDEVLHPFRGIINSTLRISGKNRLSTVFKERSFQFEPELLSLRHPVTLSGYFQSWRYFEEDFYEIRQILVPTLSHQEHLNSIIAAMPSSDWIGIHIRRGDYLRIGTMSVLGSAYFKHATNALEESFPNVPRVVFSDDIESAREVFPGGHLYLGPGEVPSAGDSLMLLSMSRALVCSNSSFSWWAAFLNPDRHEKVIFPNTWFTHAEMKWDDLLLPEWLRAK